jgi:SAM-dependent methyltransferase
VTGEGGYTFRLDDDEIARFRAMAGNAERHEHALWTRAGIVPGATVVDLGCGPGALLPLMAQRIGPNGTILAVDTDPVACATARQVAAGVDSRVRIVCADAADTGLSPGLADVVVCRNLLIHNGNRAAALLAHAATLLRPGGHLVSAEPDVDGIEFEAAEAEREYERRWAAMARADGNDPSLGEGDRLQRLLQTRGWRILDIISWTDHLVIDRSPAWAAAEAVVSRGFATPEELAGWRRALERRRAAGPLRCSVPVTTTVAAPVREDPS